MSINGKSNCRISLLRKFSWNSKRFRRVFFGKMVIDKWRLFRIWKFFRIVVFKIRFKSWKIIKWIDKCLSKVWLSRCILGIIFIVCLV